MSEHKKPEPMFPVDVEGAPKIILAGRQWPVPKLAIEQWEHVVPALMSIMPVMDALMSAFDVKDDGQVEVKDYAKLAQAMTKLDAETLAKANTAVFWALKRATPGLGLGEFRQFPADLYEIIAALPVVMRQVGLFKPKAAGDPPAGEAKGAEPAPSTGTGSLPESAS